VVLASAGIVLLLFFDPSSDTVRYEGSYPLLQGVPVSKAYASTMHISLEVPGGLLVRQTHHWAALVLPGALLLQMLGTFFTGGFRSPRHWSWVLLALTFLLALAGGWSGYGLPDDLLSSTGLRIAQGILVGIPVVGTRASFLLLGGEFPGDVVEHMYWLHVAAVPVLLVLVLAMRLRLVVRRSPSRRSRGGRSARDVVPLAGAVVGALGLLFVTCGVLVLMGALATVNPLWTNGPSSTGHASAGSQPDWYTGFLDGALRLVPSGWEASVLGGTVPFGVLLPQAVVGGFVGTVVLWPFVEAFATGDRRQHHLLDRPREHPVRTPLGVAGITFFLTLWGAGATDLVTSQLGIAFEHQVVALRTVLVLGPLVAYQATRQLCLGLLAQEREIAGHGQETGRIVRSPDGGYSEVLSPLDAGVRPSEHRPIAQDRVA